MASVKQGGQIVLAAGADLLDFFVDLGGQAGDAGEEQLDGELVRGRDCEIRPRPRS